MSGLTSAMSRWSALISAEAKATGKIRPREAWFYRVGFGAGTLEAVARLRMQ